MVCLVGGARTLLLVGMLRRPFRRFCHVLVLVGCSVTGGRTSTGLWTQAMSGNALGGWISAQGNLGEDEEFLDIPEYYRGVSVLRLLIRLGYPVPLEGSRGLDDMTRTKGVSRIAQRNSA